MSSKSKKSQVQIPTKNKEALTVDGLLRLVHKIGVNIPPITTLEEIRANAEQLGLSVVQERGFPYAQEIHQLKEYLEKKEILIEAFAKDPHAILNAAIMVTENYPVFLEKILLFISPKEIDWNKKMRGGSPETKAFSHFKIAGLLACVGKNKAFLTILKHATVHNSKLIMSSNLAALLFSTIHPRFNHASGIEVLRLFNEHDDLNTLDFAYILDSQESVEKKFEILDLIIKSAGLGYSKIFLSLLNSSNAIADILKEFIELAKQGRGEFITALLYSISVYYQNINTPNEIKKQIKEILQSLDLDVENVLVISTPLHSAIFAADTKTVEMLCQQAMANGTLEVLLNSTIRDTDVTSAKESNEENEAFNPLNSLQRTIKALAYSIQPHSLAVALILMRYHLKIASNIDMEIINGKTLLSIFAEAGFVEGVKEIVESGADIENIDQTGKTVLHHVILKSMIASDASQEKFTEVVKILLSKKANVNARDSKYNTPLHYITTTTPVIKIYVEANPHLAPHFANSQLARKVYKALLIKNFNENIFRYLCAHNPDLTLENGDGISVQNQLNDEENPDFNKMQEIMEKLKADNDCFVESSMALFEKIKSIISADAPKFPHEVVGSILSYSDDFSQYRTGIEILNQVTGLFEAWKKKEVRLKSSQTTSAETMSTEKKKNCHV